MRLRGYVIKPSTGTDYVDGADPDPADNTAHSNLGTVINLLYTHRLIG